VRWPSKEEENGVFNDRREHTTGALLERLQNREVTRGEGCKNQSLREGKESETNRDLGRKGGNGKGPTCESPKLANRMPKLN